MKNDAPCYQCPDRFPGCSASCKKPQYLEHKQKEAEKNELIRKNKKKNEAFNTYAVEVARKKKARYRKK